MKSLGITFCDPIIACCIYYYLFKNIDLYHLDKPHIDFFVYVQTLIGTHKFCNISKASQYFSILSMAFEIMFKT